jgi:ethanolamine ammonia-lyase small subunit
MMDNKFNSEINEDIWHPLKAFTAARIALGRTGTAIPLKEVLQFRLAFAYAKDAVYSELNTEQLMRQLKVFKLPIYSLQSKAINRAEYLQRPDFGRLLNTESIDVLKNNKPDIKYDVAIIIADGLSATAINNHAFPVIQLLIEALNRLNYTIAPLSIVKQGRVAIGDETGYYLNAQMSVVLIGERPGLTSPDSMGAYLTFNPKQGLTDESRNCVSNIRPEGLIYALAAQKMMYLIQESLRLQLSGVHLKDNSLDNSRFDMSNSNTQKIGYQ